MTFPVLSDYFDKKWFHDILNSVDLFKQLYISQKNSLV